MRSLRGSRPIATASPIVPRLIRAPVPLGITTLTSHRFQTCHARKVRILSSYCNRRSTPLSFVRDMHTYVSLSRSAVMRRASAFRVPIVSPSRSNAASQHRNEKRPRAPRGNPETQTGTAGRPKRPLYSGPGCLGLEAARRACLELDDADMKRRQRARRRRPIAAPAWHTDIPERDTTSGRLPHARGHAVDSPLR